MSDYIWEQYEAAKEAEGGFVLYPREYCINQQDAFKSYVKGVDENGKLCVVFLKLEDRFVQQAKENISLSVPSFARLSEVGRNAKNPCYSSRDNSKTNPEGVLLIEQATLLKHDQMERFNLYYCKWMSVLRASSDQYDPEPVSGYGYLEINLSNKLSNDAAEQLIEYKNIQNNIKQAAQNGEPVVELIEQSEKVAANIIASRKKWYSAITMDIDKTEVIEPNRNDLYNKFLSTVKQYTTAGEYGNLLVRVRDGNKVISALCGVIKHGFDFSKKSIQDPNESFNLYMKFGGGKALAQAKSQGLTVEVIPARQTNFNISGHKFTEDIEKALKKGATPKLFKTFMEKEFHFIPDIDPNKEKAFVCSKIAIRRSRLRNQHEGNLLGGSIHAYSKPICNAFEIGPDGGRAYLMDYKIKNPESAQKLAS